MTQTVVPARKGPHSVTHAFPNTRVDERGLVALLGIVCRVRRKGIMQETRCIFYRNYVSG